MKGVDQAHLANKPASIPWLVALPDRGEQERSEATISTWRARWPKALCRSAVLVRLFGFDQDWQISTRQSACCTPKACGLARLIDSPDAVDCLTGWEGRSSVMLMARR